MLLKGYLLVCHRGLSFVQPFFFVCKQLSWNLKPFRVTNVCGWYCSPLYHWYNRWIATENTEGRFKVSTWFSMDQLILNIKKQKKIKYSMFNRSLKVKWPVRDVHLDNARLQEVCFNYLGAIFEIGHALEKYCLYLLLVPKDSQMLWSPYPVYSILLLLFTATLDTWSSIYRTYLDPVVHMQKTSN